MDKASVLGETIRLVKELKKEAAEVEAACRRGGREDEECIVPSGADRLSLEYCGELGGGGGREVAVVMKAVLSCEDREGLMAEVARAVRSVKGGKALRAEMVSVGGRTKICLWVEALLILGAKNEQELLGVLRRALKVIIMDRPLLSLLSPNLNTNNNLRFLQSDSF